MSGRKKVPSQLKITRGTAQPVRMNPFEPKLPVEQPPAPDWLSELAQTTFLDIAQKTAAMKVLAAKDGLALELLADAYSEYRQARQKVIKEGPTYNVWENIQYRDKDGEVQFKKQLKAVKTRPEVVIAANAWRRVATMLAEFGLTPASGSKVSVLEQGEVDPLQKLLNS
jgi:P27 family predicted phage terminase small subunit